MDLTASETSQLEHVYSTSTNAVARRRSQCLLLSSSRHTINQLTGIFSVCRLTIYHWFDHWQTDGLASLRHKPGKGRKRKLAAVAPSVLEALVRETPQNLHAVLHELATTHAVECSRDTLRRHLKKRAMAVSARPQHAQRQA